MFELKTAEELEAMTAKELGQYYSDKAKSEKEALEKSFNDKIEALEKSKSSAEDTSKLEKSIEKLREEQKAAVKEMEAYAVKVKALGEVSVGKDRSMTPIKEKLEQHKEQIKGLKNTHGTIEFEIEDKSSHTSTDIADRSELGQFIRGVAEIPYQRSYMKDEFTVLPATTEYIKQVEQNTVVRDAKNIALCGITTHDSKVTFKVTDMKMEKVRDFTDVCIDMMEDYDFVEGQIRKLVSTDVMLKVDSQLLLGSGSSPYLNSVDSYASSFSASTSGANYAGAVDTPQLVDLIVVAGAQIEAFGAQNFWSPTTVMLNPVDYTKMLLLKDTQKNYISANVIKPSIFMNNNGVLYINGIKVVKNPNVPANEFYIFDARQGTIYQRRGTVVEMSYENATNFEQELVTVKAYERLNLWVPSTQKNAFMHVSDIDAALAAITAT